MSVLKATEQPDEVVQCPEPSGPFLFEVVFGGLGQFLARVEPDDCGVEAESGERMER